MSRCAGISRAGPRRVETPVENSLFPWAGASASPAVCRSRPGATELSWLRTGNDGLPELEDWWEMRSAGQWARSSTAIPARASSRTPLNTARRSTDRTSASISSDVTKDALSKVLATVMPKGVLRRYSTATEASTTSRVNSSPGLAASVLSRGWWEGQRRIDRCHRRIKGLRGNAYDSTGSLAVSRLLYAVFFLPRTLPPTSAKSLIKKTSTTGLHRHCNAMTRYAMVTPAVTLEADHAARSIQWLY